MTEFSNVPSPFCGIGTDDLKIKVDGLSLEIIENGCPVNTPAFEQPLGDTSPRSDGETCTLEEAVLRAAALLRSTNQPLYGGCATDVNGMRALMSLADRNGAIVDNLKFSTSRSNYLAMQDSGWMNTTLAEIKNRCDLLLLIGTDLESFSPRFFERFMWTENAMFLNDPLKRQVVYLGRPPSGELSSTPAGDRARVLECSESDLPEVTAVLRVLVKGGTISYEQVGGIPVAELQELAHQLIQATYGVVCWASGSLDFSQAELTVQSICELVKDVNERGVRCSGFPLGGKEGDQTANQVCGWQTGYPARMGFAAGIPEYEPFQYDTDALLANGEADALLWVQAFSTAQTPPATDVPSIVVGRAGMEFVKEPDIYIPVGTPGIDHAGHAFRMDNVVAVRLRQLRQSGIPTTFDVLTAIEKAL